MIVVDITTEVEDAVKASIKSILKEYKISSCEIQAGEDHDEDRVIFVDIFYTYSEKEIDPSIVAILRSDLRRRLIKLGDDRFPHIRHHFDARQKVKA